MKRDEERIERNRQALKGANLGALVCALPMNVLLLTGYWSVVGTALAIFTRDGKTGLLVPKDESESARRAWADKVKTFSPGSLTELKSVVEAVEKPLAEFAAELKIKGKIGFEGGGTSEPVSYAAMHLYGADIKDLLKSAIPKAKLVSADETLARLRSVLTPNEIEAVRLACDIAAKAFEEGAKHIRAGLRETEVAAAFRAPLSVFGGEVDSFHRADGFAFCMSGENSYQASAAYQRTRLRRLKAGDLALVHCNSYAGGFWTDITRTFCLGEPGDEQRKMYEAVFDALEEAVKAIRPGVKASKVDRAAREVLKNRGFGKAFKHGLGHGVGFHAIDHSALPRLHPASPDRLETGMVFNIEPAIYIENFGGMRHCDMVAVTEDGAEILTPFQNGIEQMIIRQM